MAQQVNDSPREDEEQPQPAGLQRPGISHRQATAGIIFFLVLVGLLILSSTGILLFNVVQIATGAYTLTPTATTTQQGSGTAIPTTTTGGTQVASATSTVSAPLFLPDSATPPPFQLPADHYVLYEQQNNIYMVSSAGGIPQLLSTPGYIYNQAVRPILTPSGQLLYSGDGIWLADVLNGTAEQIVSLASGQVITSMALSSDGTTLAWSTEPANGNGMIDIFAASLDAPLKAFGQSSKVFEQPSTSCPCFRVFGFMNGPAKQADSTLLLTDDQQSQEAIQFGLWSLDLTKPLSATPQLLLDENGTQGPLALAPGSNVLLYSSYEGEVPIPTDESVPADVATQAYANSLDVTTLDGDLLALDKSQVVLPEQHELRNTAEYHWVTTPVFTPDGHTLIYVEFSSEGQAPYDRSSAIFTAQIKGSGKSLHVSSPQLLETSSARLLELGVWYNSHILMLYADGTLYALDVQSGAVATIAQTGAYARIIGIVGSGAV